MHGVHGGNPRQLYTFIPSDNFVENLQRYGQGSVKRYFYAFLFVEK